MLYIDDDRRSDYLFCGPRGLILDGSSENACGCHPDNRLIGSLLKYAATGTSECNASAQYFHFLPTTGNTFLPATLFRDIIFIAARDIAPLEEIRFDYGDRTCDDMFAPARRMSTHF